MPVPDQYSTCSTRWVLGCPWERTWHHVARWLTAAQWLDPEEHNGSLAAAENHCCKHPRLWSDQIICTKVSFSFVGDSIRMFDEPISNKNPGNIGFLSCLTATILVLACENGRLENSALQHFSALSCRLFFSRLAFTTNWFMNKMALPACTWASFPPFNYTFARDRAACNLQSEGHSTGHDTIYHVHST